MRDYLNEEGNEYISLSDTKETSVKLLLMNIEMYMHALQDEIDLLKKVVIKDE